MGILCRNSNIFVMDMTGMCNIDAARVLTDPLGFLFLICINGPHLLIHSEIVSTSSFPRFAPCLPIILAGSHKNCKLMFPIYAHDISAVLMNTSRREVLLILLRLHCYNVPVILYIWMGTCTSTIRGLRFEDLYMLGDVRASILADPH